MKKLEKILATTGLLGQVLIVGGIAADNGPYVYLGLILNAPLSYWAISDIKENFQYKVDFKIDRK